MLKIAQNVDFLGGAKVENFENPKKEAITTRNHSKTPEMVFKHHF